MLQARSCVAAPETVHWSNSKNAEASAPIGCLLRLHMFPIRSTSRQDALRGEEWIMCLFSLPSCVGMLHCFKMKRMLALFKCSYIKIFGDELVFMHTGCVACMWGWVGWLVGGMEVRSPGCSGYFWRLRLVVCVCVCETGGRFGLIFFLFFFESCTAATFPHKACVCVWQLRPSVMSLHPILLCFCYPHPALQHLPQSSWHNHPGFEWNWRWGVAKLKNLLKFRLYRGGKRRRKNDILIT